MKEGTVTIIGYPAGEWSKTDGTISSVTGGMLGMADLYAVTAKAWHGNSGGALFDANNNLIGVVIATGAVEGYNDDVTYAVKASKIKSALSGKGFQL